MTTQVVKYYGRFAVASRLELCNIEKAFVELLPKLQLKAEDWNELRMQSHSTHKAIEKALRNDDECAQHFRKFQVDLIADAILPYMDEMTAVRLSLDKNRIGQVSRLLEIIENSFANISTVSYHPSQTLESFQFVLDEVNASGGMFKSKLAKNLEISLRKQWTPIIDDHRIALRNIGGRFIAIGLVETLGRPMIVAIPLYMIAATVMKVLTEYKEKNSLSADSMLQLLKCAVLLLAGVQLLQLMSLLTGVGHLCLFCGVAAMMLSCSDAHIKRYAPVLAPHLVSVDQLLDKLAQLGLTLNGAQATVTQMAAQVVKSTGSGSGTVSTPAAALLVSSPESAASQAPQHTFKSTCSPVEPNDSDPATTPDDSLYDTYQQQQLRKRK